MAPLQFFGKNKNKNKKTSLDPPGPRYNEDHIGYHDDGSYDRPGHPAVDGPRVPKDIWYRHFSHLTIEDRVVIRHKSANPYGWSSELDSMMHTPCHIMAIYPNGVILQNPMTGASQLVPLECLDMDYIEHKKANRKHMRGIRRPGEPTWRSYGGEPATATGEKIDIVTSYAKDSVTYTLVKTVSVRNLRDRSLVEDYEKLKNIFGGNKYISLEEKYFEAMKSDCPRIFGVLFGHNFLIKTTEEGEADVKNE